MGIKKKSDWTEERIQDKLRLYFLSKSTKKYEILNKYIYAWESDYLAITKSGLVYECEIKISRTDFFNDIKKQHKFLIVEGKLPQYERPNYFYYVVPDGLINPDEVPKGFGLIYVNTWSINIVKKAEQLHKEKADLDKLKLMDKFYWGMIEYMDKYRKSDIRKLKSENKRLKKTIMEYDDMLSNSNGVIDEIKQHMKVIKTKLEKSCEPLPDDIQKFIDENFWDLI